MENKNCVSTWLMTYLSSPPADKREELVWRISDQGKLAERRRDFSPQSHDCSREADLHLLVKKVSCAQIQKYTIIGAGAS